MQRNFKDGLKKLWMLACCRQRPGSVPRKRVLKVRNSGVYGCKEVSNTPSEKVAQRTEVTYILATFLTSMSPIIYRVDGRK